MMKDQIVSKMMFILPGDEGKRYHVSVNDAGQAKVMLDLHELNKFRAARLLNNVISIIREPFTLEVVHGYNHGTVLRTYVNEEMKNKRMKVTRICVPRWCRLETIFTRTGLCTRPLGANW